MKRLFILGATIIAFSANISATEKSTIVEKLNSESTQKAVARYLGTSTQQENDLSYVFNQSVRRYNKEKARGNSEAIANEKAMNFSLANARAILSPEQYKKFIIVLNMTMINDSNAALLAEK